MHLPDEAATHAFGRELAASVRAGDVIALTGGLGAGKTHLTQGLVAGLGGRGSVTSPTFTLVHEYAGGRLPVYHFDLYRLDRAEEALALGWEDYLDRDGVCVVEWADKFPELLPAGTRWFRLRVSGTGREVEEGDGPPQP